MKTYQIESYCGSIINLFAADPIIEAETGRKALAKYLKQIGFKGKVKCSADTRVEFKVTPVVVENERILIDRRNGQRALWYKIIN